MELTAIATNVPLPQVIDQKEYDVGLIFLLCPKGKTSQ